MKDSVDCGKLVVCNILGLSKVKVRLLAGTVVSCDPWVEQHSLEH